MKAELALIESEEQNIKVGNFLCRAHMGCKNWNLIGGVWIGYFLKQDETGFVTEPQLLKYVVTEDSVLHTAV